LPDPAVPAQIADLMAADAIRLFVRRAEAARATFALTPANAQAVATLCRRLDGLPLAIELAAGQCDLNSPEELLVRLERHDLALDDGPRDASDRHRGLDAAIGWSYELLLQPERRMLALLAVFSGSFTITAALAIIGALGDPEGPAQNLIFSLVAKSLLVRTENRAGDSIYRMLEVIREYAVRNLQGSVDAAEARVRHARYYAVRAEQWAAEIQDADPSEWLSHVDYEIDDMRAALVWAIEHDQATAARITTALVPIWTARGVLTEGRAWLDRVLATSEPSNAPPLRFPGEGGRAPAPRRLISGLTARERQVLRLLVDGLSDKEIAAALSISTRTVSNHVSGLLAKFGVTSRTAAATLAIREGALDSRVK
jgi:non-specific serine/threonine protein kinase